MKIDKLKSLIKLFNITIHIATNLKTTLNDTYIYIVYVKICVRLKMEFIYM